MEHNNGIVYIMTITPGPDFFLGQILTNLITVDPPNTADFGSDEKAAVLEKRR